MDLGILLFHWSWMVVPSTSSQDHPKVFQESRNKHLYKISFYLLVHRAHKTASTMSTKNTLTKKGRHPIRIHYVRTAEIAPFGSLRYVRQS